MGKLLYISLLPACYYGISLVDNWGIAVREHISATTRIENNKTNVYVNDDESSHLHRWWEDSDVILNGIWKLLKCQDFFETGRPIHNEKTWFLLRGAYSTITGPRETSININNVFRNSFQPESVEVKVTKEKGRGVYANQTFNKGDLVWRDFHTACFRDGTKFKRYLASIPSGLACDVMEWAYSGERYGICVDLDEGSLINHASLTDNEAFSNYSIDVRPNLDFESKTGYIFATQDIHVGDELLVDYLSFEDESEWENLGLGEWKG